MTNEEKIEKLQQHGWVKASDIKCEGCKNPRCANCNGKGDGKLLKYGIMKGSADPYENLLFSVEEAWNKEFND